jgi:hypothetical protein
MLVALGFGNFRVDPERRDPEAGEQRSEDPHRPGDEPAGDDEQLQDRAGDVTGAMSATCRGEEETHGKCGSKTRLHSDVVAVVRNCRYDEQHEERLDHKQS